VATLEQILNGMIEFRDETYSRLTVIETKIDEIKTDANIAKSVQRICFHCGGDGVKGAPGSTISCPDCGGDGVVMLGRITKTSEE